MRPAFHAAQQNTDLRFHALEQRLEASEQKTDAPFDAMEQRTDARFDAMEQRSDVQFKAPMAAVAEMKAQTELTLLRMLTALSERVAVLEAQRH